MRALCLAAAFIAALGSSAFAEGRGGHGGHGGARGGFHGGIHSGRSVGFNHWHRGGYGGWRGGYWFGPGWCAYHPLAPQCIF